MKKKEKEKQANAVKAHEANDDLTARSLIEVDASWDKMKWHFKN